MNSYEKKDFICIVCPNGCRIHGVISPEGQITVTGNKCKRGEDFVTGEFKNPVRSLTTTVKTVFSELPYLPVRTDGEIPKNLIQTALQQLAAVIIGEPVCCGDVVFENLAETGVNVIATMDLTQPKEQKI